MRKPAPAIGARRWCSRLDLDMVVDADPVTARQIRKIQLLLGHRPSG